MRGKAIRLTSLAVSLCLLSSVFIGCGKEDNKATPSSTSTAVQTTADTTSQGDAPVYPIKTDHKLTYWLQLNPAVAANYKTMADTPFAKELEKKTGVKVEYIHPAMGQETDAFNILLASGDLPDIIENPWFDVYKGGPAQGIESKIILKANDYLKQYAPNYTKYLQENPAVDKASKLDDGTYFGFTMVRGDSSLMVYHGPVIRQDWLKELGLEAPTTMEEWYNVLKAFKDKKGATSPLGWANSQGSQDLTYPFAGRGAFVGAYGIVKGLYQDDGKVKFGAYEPAFKDFLAEMAKWYSEGLINKNFAAVDSKTFDADLLGGKVGAAMMNVGGGLGKYIPLLKEKDPNAELAPTVYPTLKKGDRAKFGQSDFAMTKTYVDVITTSCKNVEVAAKWLDFGYTEEGGLLYNFGVEGESYKMENGYPKMTDTVMKNPNGLPMSQAWASYARAPYGGAFIQRKEYAEQYNQLPAQLEALKLWPQHDGILHWMPPVTTTTDEASEYTKLITAIETYVDEFNVKVIMGVTPISEFDKFRDELKKMGIERVIEIQQGALDRFNKR